MVRYVGKRLPPARRESTTAYINSPARIRALITWETRTKPRYMLSSRMDSIKARAEQYRVKKKKVSAPLRLKEAEAMSRKINIQAIYMRLEW